MFVAAAPAAGAVAVAAEAVAAAAVVAATVVVPAVVAATVAAVVVAVAMVAAVPLVGAEKVVPLAMVDKIVNTAAGRAAVTAKVAAGIVAAAVVAVAALGAAIGIAPVVVVAVVQEEHLLSFLVLPPTAAGQILLLLLPQLPIFAAAGRLCSASCSLNLDPETASNSFSVAPGLSRFSRRRFCCALAYLSRRQGNLLGRERQRLDWQIYWRPLHLSRFQRRAFGLLPSRLRYFPARQCPFVLDHFCSRQRTASGGEQAAGLQEGYQELVGRPTNESCVHLGRALDHGRRREVGTPTDWSAEHLTAQALGQERH